MSRAGRYVKQSVRGDWNCWADPSDVGCPAPLKEWITHLDAFVVKVVVVVVVAVVVVVVVAAAAVVVVVEVVVIGAQVLDRVEATKSVEVLRGSSMMTCYPGNNARYIR